MENGQIKNLNFLQGETNYSALFVGSSLMGQYYPRAKLIYTEDSQKKPKLTAIFASRNHCTPLPNFDLVSAPENINCIDYYNSIIALAKRKDIKKIIFAANWPRLTSNNKLTYQTRLFISDINLLTKLGKEVIIISKPPIYDGFDPMALSKKLRITRQVELDDFFVYRNNIEDIESLNELTLISRITGVILINPYDYLCEKTICYAVKNASPLYNDSHHIRASFAEEKATFIDKIVIY
jgi:hypothetical protein